MDRKGSLVAALKICPSRCICRDSNSNETADIVIPSAKAPLFISIFIIFLVMQTHSCQTSNYIPTLFSVYINININISVPMPFARRYFLPNLNNSFNQSINKLLLKHRSVQEILKPETQLGYLENSRNVRNIFNRRWMFTESTLKTHYFNPRKFLASLENALVPCTLYLFLLRHSYTPIIVVKFVF